MSLESQLVKRNRIESGFSIVDEKHDLEEPLSKRSKRMSKPNETYFSHNNHFNNYTAYLDIDDTDEMIESHECLVCFEEFIENSRILQCEEGHLLCEICYPKYSKCPTCQTSLSSKGIRNRALEDTINKQTKKYNKYSKNHERNNNNNNNKLLRLQTTNKFCDCYFFMINKQCAFKCNIKNENDLNKHHRYCDARPMKCSFTSCYWEGAFNTFEKHLSDTHTTCLSPTIHEPQILNKVYQFTHAIKFPGYITTGKQESDLIWSKVFKFNDNAKFFVIAKYCQRKVTVFARYLKLPDISHTNLQRMQKIAIDKINNIDNINNPGNNENNENNNNINNNNTTNEDDFDVDMIVVNRNNIGIEQQSVTNEKKKQESSNYSNLLLSFSNGEGIKLGKYWIEIKYTQDQQMNNNNNNNNNISTENDFNLDNFATAPLRWPQNLYSVCVPFDWEFTHNTLLSIDRSIFEQYWKLNNQTNSAVLKFKFTVNLH